MILLSSWTVPRRTHFATQQMALLWTDGLEPSVSLLGRTLSIAALAALLMFFARLYQVRTQFRAVMAKHEIVSIRLVSSETIQCQANESRSRSCLTHSCSDT